MTPPKGPPEVLMALVAGPAVEVEASTMRTSYDLLDHESGNLVGSYATEEEARAVVRRACEAEGDDGALGLGLVRVRDGDQELVAEDRALLRDAAAPAGASTSRS